MITISEVEKEIDQIIDDRNENARRGLVKFTKRQITSMQKRCSFLEFIKRYLQSNPSEEFIKKEIARLNSRLSKLDGMIPRNATKEIIEQYRVENDFKKMKQQVIVLRFILKN